MDNILKTAIKVELPAARASCHNTTDLTTDASESVNRQVASQRQIILKFFFSRAWDIFSRAWDKEKILNRISDLRISRSSSLPLS